MIAAFRRLLFYLEISISSHTFFDIKITFIFFEANICIFRRYFYNFPKFLSVQTIGRKRLVPLLKGHPVCYTLDVLFWCQLYISDILLKWMIDSLITRRGQVRKVTETAENCFLTVENFRCLVDVVGQNVSTCRDEDCQNQSKHKFPEN